MNIKTTFAYLGFMVISLGNATVQAMEPVSTSLAPFVYDAQVLDISTPGSMVLVRIEASGSSSGLVCITSPCDTLGVSFQQMDSLLIRQKASPVRGTTSYSGAIEVRGRSQGRMLSDITTEINFRAQLQGEGQCDRGRCEAIMTYAATGSHGLVYNADLLIRFELETRDGVVNVRLISYVVPMDSFWDVFIHSL